MLPHIDRILSRVLTLYTAFHAGHALPVSHSTQTQTILSQSTPPDYAHAQVLILGGGVAGVIAARTLQERGISDFIIVEARHELGGRLMSHSTLR